MEQIILDSISKKLTAKTPEYRVVLPKVTDISKQEEIRLEIELLEDRISEFEITLYPLQIARPEFFPSIKGRVAVAGKGSRSVAVPFEQFAFRQMVRAFLKYLDGISVKLLTGGPVILKKITADTVGSLDVQVENSSKTGEAKEWVEYPVVLVNKSEKQTVVNICQSLYGKECLPTKYLPYTVLESYESKEYSVKVEVTEDIPAGGLEKSIFLFIPDGNSAEAKKVIFQTSKKMTHPYLFLKEEQWQKRKDAFAKDNELYKVFCRTYVEPANNWEVPKPSESEEFVYPAYVQNMLFHTVVAWKITENRKYFEKAMQFFEGLLDTTGER